TWGVALGGGGTAFGATLAYQQTHLDAAQSTRWTLDVGARRSFSDAVTLAAATHFFSRFATGDAAQELYGAVEVRVWHGPLWGTRGAVRGRYGIATAHGFSADHQFGAGFELGPQFGCDLLVEREGSYGRPGWRAGTGGRGGGGGVGSARSGAGRQRRPGAPRCGRSWPTRSRWRGSPATPPNSPATGRRNSSGSSPTVRRSSPC